MEIKEKAKRLDPNRPPTSDDIFDIYQDMLKSINNVNTFIVSNKMDRKYYKNIKENLKNTTDIITVTVQYLKEIKDEVSTVSGLFNALTLKSFANSCDSLIDIIGYVSRINTEIMSVNIFKPNFISFRLRAIKSSFRGMFDLIEFIGTQNPSFGALADVNLKLLEDSIESLRLCLYPLDKISIMQIIQYRVRIRRFKKVFHKMFDFIDDIGQYNPLKLIKGSINLILMGKVIQQLNSIPETLNKYSLGFLIKSKIWVKRMGKLLLGRKKLFGKSRGKRTGGILNLFEEIGEISPITILKSNVNILLLKTALMALNTALNSLAKVKMMDVVRYKQAVNGYGEVLFAGTKGFWIFKRKYIGVLPLLTKIGRYKSNSLINGIKITIIMSIAMNQLSSALHDIVHNKKIGFFKRRKISRILKSYNTVLFGRKGHPTEGLLHMLNRIGTYNPVKMLKGSLVILMMNTSIWRLNSVIAKLTLMLPLVPLAWLSVKLIKSIFKGIVLTYVSLSRHLRHIKKGAKSLKLISESILLVFGGLLAAVAVIVLVAAAMLLVPLVILGLVLMFVFISMAAKSIRKGIEILILMSITLILLSVSLLLISSLAAISIPMLIFTGVLLGLVFVFAIAGLAFKYIVMGAIAILLMGVALMSLYVPLLIIAKTLDMINNMEIDNKCIVDNIMKPFANAIGYMFDNIKLFNPASLLIFNILLGQLVMISLSIGMMAKTLQSIASLNIPIEWDAKGNPIKYQSMQSEDFQKAAINANMIVTFFTSLFNPNCKALPDGTKIMPVDLDGLVNINARNALKFKQLNKIVGYVGDMAKTLSEVSMLKIPTEFDKNGKPNKWHNMVDTDFVNASNNISVIMTTMVEAVSKASEKVENVKRRNLKKLQMVMETTTPITSMVEAIRNLATGVIPIYAVKGDVIKLDENGNPKIEGYQHLDVILNDPKLQTNIQSIFTTVINAIAKLAGDGKFKDNIKSASKFINKNGEILTQMCDLSSNIADVVKKFIDLQIDEKKFNQATNAASEVMNLYRNWMNTPKAVEVYERQVNATTKLLTSVNKVNTDKLVKVTNLMAQLATFSKSINGNFDRLATIINNKLLKALEELNRSINNVGSGGTTAATAQSVTVKDNLTTDNKSAKPETTKIHKSKKIDTMHDGMVEDELDEIIRLLAILAKDKNY